MTLFFKNIANSCTIVIFISILLFLIKPTWLLKIIKFLIRYLTLKEKAVQNKINNRNKKASLFFT